MQNGTPLVLTRTALWLSVGNPSPVFHSGTSKNEVLGPLAGSKGHYSCWEHWNSRQAARSHLKTEAHEWSPS